MQRSTIRHELARLNIRLTREELEQVMKRMSGAEDDDPDENTASISNLNLSHVTGSMAAGSFSMGSAAASSSGGQKPWRSATGGR
jgi:hypothetical protein